MMGSAFTISNPMLFVDGYKTDHRRQYPEGTEVVYSNFTPRKSRIEGVDYVVNFGLQYFLKKYLVEMFDVWFFKRDKQSVVAEYTAEMDAYLGKDAIQTDHIEALWELGYLPLEIRALPEGERVPMKVPLLTIRNTHPDFFWLTNQLETIMSATLWVGCTSATLAYLYRKRFDEANALTGIPADFAKFQGHDFSFRGMSSLESAMISGAAHLTSFAGTDTVPAIAFAKHYYNASGLVGCSVPATEHSVAGLNIIDIQESAENGLAGLENGRLIAEIDSMRRLITQVYPTGIVSYVADTYDFWSVLTRCLPKLKPEIMAREGKLVIRPDSGDPVKIVCGDPEAPEGTPERVGAIECLWNTFGGSIVDGYKHLDSHVGLIYGDSITLERQDAILSLLMKKGFAPNIVLGIGSYTYQMKSRDTFGFAMKATYGVVNGQPREIFKDPATDRSAEKKSAKGLLRVDRVNGQLVLKDQCSEPDHAGGCLETVFRDGEILRETDFQSIRRRLHGESF